MSWIHENPQSASYQTRTRETETFVLFSYSCAAFSSRWRALHLDISTEYKLLFRANKTSAACNLKSNACNLKCVGGYRRACRRGGFGEDRKKKRPEGWITSVECLQAPSGWCSRFAAAAGVAGAAAVAAGMAAEGKAAAAVAAERAPARPDCAITIAVTSSTRSRWLVPPSGAARAFPPPRPPVIAAASSMAAGKRFTASPAWCPLRPLHLRMEPSQVSSIASILSLLWLVQTRSVI